jgi:hypothetical protein
VSPLLAFFNQQGKVSFQSTAVSQLHPKTEDMTNSYTDVLQCDVVHYNVGVLAMLLDGHSYAQLILFYDYPHPQSCVS